MFVVIDILLKHIFFPQNVWMVCLWSLLPIFSLGENFWLDHASKRNKNSAYNFSHVIIQGIFWRLAPGFVDFRSFLSGIFWDWLSQNSYFNKVCLVVISNILAQREIEDGSHSYIWLTKATMKNINISHYGQTQNPLICIQRNVRGYATASQKKGSCKWEQLEYKKTEVLNFCNKNLTFQNCTKYTKMWVHC